jgi:hypothetical protein
MLVVDILRDSPDKPTLDWLMNGDPAIRWQVMRDLSDAPAHQYEAERARVGEEGWGRQLLKLQCDDGRWTKERGPKGFRGLYTPKWTSTTYTLTLLRRLGLEPRHPAAIRGCDALVQGAKWLGDGSIAPWSSDKTDTCVCSMILAVLEWFEHDERVRRDGLLEYLLANQKDDGGWNCDAGSEVSSMHTTVSTLEALQIRRSNSPSSDIDAAMRGGWEYLLERRLFRSKSTGEVIRADFRTFSFPPRWYYDVLRALDHLQHADSPRDERAEEAIELVRSKRREDGRWPLQNNKSGERHFEMEKVGEPSRWNTLRALRVLRWWGE